jgi:hypothetical protein
MYPKACLHIPWVLMVVVMCDRPCSSTYDEVESSDACSAISGKVTYAQHSPLKRVALAGSPGRRKSWTKVGARAAASCCAIVSHARVAACRAGLPNRCNYARARRLTGRMTSFGGRLSRAGHVAWYCSQKSIAAYIWTE